MLCKLLSPCFWSFCGSIPCLGGLIQSRSFQALDLRGLKESKNRSTYSLPFNLKWNIGLCLYRSLLLKASLRARCSEAKNLAKLFQQLQSICCTVAGSSLFSQLAKEIICCGPSIHTVHRHLPISQGRLDLRGHQRCSNLSPHGQKSCDIHMLSCQALWLSSYHLAG